RLAIRRNDDGGFVVTVRALGNIDLGRRDLSRWQRVELERVFREVHLRGFLGGHLVAGAHIVDRAIRVPFHGAGLRLYVKAGVGLGLPRLGAGGARVGGPEHLLRLVAGGEALVDHGKVLHFAGLARDGPDGGVARGGDGRREALHRFTQEADVFAVAR